MSQAANFSVPLIGPVTPTTMATRIDDSFEALQSSHSGNARPSYAVPGTVWVSTATAGMLKRYIYDGVNDHLIGVVNIANGADDDNVVAINASIDLAGFALQNAAIPNVFRKLDRYSPAFKKTGDGTISIKAGTVVEVYGKLYQFAADMAVTMPALTAGTDYAIWIKPDGTLVATMDFTSPPVANSRMLGCFHYAPGGNAAGYNLGGDTTPAINPYSIFDLKYRPACSDWRGMAAIDGAWCCDIYLLNGNHTVNGTSKYNVSIADGNSPPKIPLSYGGNGTTAYSTLTRYEAAEVLAAYGKQLPSHAEFAAAAFGTVENTSSGGTDVPTTGVTGTGATSAWNKFTSKWGIIQAAGCMWVCGADFGGPYAAAAWANDAGGRGQTYNMPNALILGGSWGLAANCGSRASNWVNSPSYSAANVGARGRCDLLILD